MTYTSFPIYVPTLTAPCRSIIVHGSAIVGVGPIEVGKKLVYYEGNIYNSVTLLQFSQRVRRAATRAELHYPTIAKMLIPLHDLMPVGMYWPATPSITIADYLTLEAWLLCP